MTGPTVLYVAPCPIKPCSWKSDPATNEEQAREERRAHINGHTHASLVAYLTSGLNGVERYESVAHEEPA